MKMTRTVLAVVLLVQVIGACGFVKGKDEAQKVAEAMFTTRIETGGFQEDRHYSDEFWENTDPDRWKSLKKLVDIAMGNLLSYSLRNWNVQSKVQTGQLSGTFVVLQYDTVYEKGQGTETLTLHKPLMGKAFSILGHKFDSPAIERLIRQGIEKAGSGSQV